MNEFAVAFGREIDLSSSASPGSADAEFIDRIVAAIPHTVEVPRSHEIPDVMNDLAAAMARGAGSCQSS